MAISDKFRAVHGTATRGSRVIELGPIASGTPGYPFETLKTGKRLPFHLSRWPYIRHILKLPPQTTPIVRRHRSIRTLKSGTPGQVGHFYLINSPTCLEKPVCGKRSHQSQGSYLTQERTPLTVHSLRPTAVFSFSPQRLWYPPIGGSRPYSVCINQRLSSQLYTCWRESV